MGRKWEAWEVRRTPTLNRFLGFLQDYVAEEQMDLDWLKELKESMSDEDRAAIHVLLGVFLDSDELQDIFSQEENEDRFECVLINVDKEEVKLTVDMFTDIVLGLELVPESVDMILANPSLKIIKTIAESLFDKIYEQNLGTAADVWKKLLISFLHLSKTSPDYDQYLINSFNYFVKNYQLIESHDKLIALIGLVIGALVIPEDYQKSDELSVLLNEWGFVNYAEIQDTPMKSIYSAIFSEKPVPSQSVDVRVVTLLDKLLETVPVNKEKTSEISDSSFGTVSRYLGACAYLIKMLLQRHLSFGAADYPNLTIFVEKFIQEKPKMKEDEVAGGDILEFSSFCENMIKYGHRDVYKSDWTKKFMEYPVQEILGCSEGLEILKKYVVGGDFNLVMDFIRKIIPLAMPFFDEDERRKEVVLSMIVEGRLPNETKALIEEHFKNQIHHKLRLNKFTGNLHAMKLQLGNIEFETDPVKKQTNEAAVIKLCMQKPWTVTRKLLYQCILTQHFNVLNFLKPFFNLSVPHEDDQPSKLGVAATAKILNEIPPFPNVFYDSFSTAMEHLVSIQLLSGYELFELVKNEILQQLSHSKVALSKVVGLIGFLEHVIPLLEAPESLKLGTFAVNLRRFFCLYTNQNTFSEAVKIKSILGKLLQENFKGLGTPRVDIDETLDGMESVFNTGLLYLRYPQFRNGITAYWKENYEVGMEDEMTMEHFVFNCALAWILNSTEDEWPALVDLFQLILSDISMLINIRDTNFPDLLNDLVLAMFTAMAQKKNPSVETFCHVFRFYSFANDLLKVNFTKSQWINILDTLLILSIEVPKFEMEKKHDVGQRLSESSGVYPVLTYLLKKIEEFSGCPFTLDNIDLKGLVTKSNMIPSVGAKLDPLRWLILEKITGLDKTSAAVA